MLSAHRFEALTCQQSATKGHERGEKSEEHTRHGILMLGRATNRLLQIREGKERDETHGVGTYHAVRRELVLLIVVIGHHAEERAVRHVDSGIGRHHEQIDTVSVDALARLSEVRRIEQQGKDQTERDGTKDDPRTVRTPTALRTVSQGAHKRVGDDIEETCHQHQRGGIGKREAKDIGEEQRKGYGHDLPRDATGGGITHGIANLLRQFDFHGFNLQYCFLINYRITQKCATYYAFAKE